jgi:Putative abortive phage resistance protein AbiGi, antitoxin
MQPDHTDYLAHFTKGPDAYKNLVSILQQQRITAGTLPWTNKPAVCFTECPWASLLDHAAHYAPYAVGFTKPHVFSAGGGPAYYVRADHFEKQQWEHDVHAFVTPFWPAYRSSKLKGAKYLKGKTVDYSHEREWRVPHDFMFDASRIAFVILDTYEDMAKFPKELKDKVGRQRFILMDMYRKIEELWPTHLIRTDG